MPELILLAGSRRAELLYRRSNDLPDGAPPPRGVKLPDTVRANGSFPQTPHGQSSGFLARARRDPDDRHSADRHRQ